MRFSEKLKFFVFGGCFVALGMALTHLTGIEAKETRLVGELKQFDTIVCKNLGIEDSNGKTRLLLSASNNNTPTILIYDEKGEATFLLSGIDPTSLVVGRLRGDHVLIDPSGVARGIDGKGVSKWP